MALSFLFASCGKKGGSPEWTAPEVEQSAASDTANGGRTRPATAKKPKSPRRTDEGLPGEGLRFIGYNLENWLTMDRFTNDRQVRDAPKPDSEKQAVIRMVVDNKPDVFGFCEVGTEKDFATIQAMLKAAGLDLPHSYYTGGADPVRHLGLLSRFPITATARPSETEYRMNGRTFGMNRGILDATIAARGRSYRFIGVHLKSKRDAEEGDQEEMRIHEAHLLRRHVDSILRADPNARLIVYGDFNDTRPSKAVKTVTGSYNDPGYLTAIPLKDSHGEAWTHYWAPHDIYSRIDFITVSRAMRSELDFRASRIIDDPEWNSASDHRPVLAVFR